MEGSANDPMAALVQAITILRADMAAATTALHQRLDTLQSTRHPLPVDTEFGETVPPLSTPRGSTSTSPSPLVLPTPFPLAAPERFQGDPDKYRTFINQCKLHFLCRPTSFPDATSKAAFLLSHLTGTAAAWANPLLESNSPMLYDFDLLVVEMSRIFDTRHKVQSRDLELLDLHQGKGTLIEYLMRFNQLSAETSWPEGKKAVVFYKGLNNSMKDALTAVPSLPTLFPDLVDLALQIDARRLERRSETRFSDHASTTVSPSSETTAEPMQIGGLRSPLTSSERERRRQDNACYYCGLLGHFVKNCPRRPKPRTQGFREARP